MIYPEGNLNYDEDCPDGCEEGRQFNNGNPGMQYDICACVARMEAKIDAANEAEREQRKSG